MSGTNPTEACPQVDTRQRPLQSRDAVDLKHLAEMRQFVFQLLLLTPLFILL